MGRSRERLALLARVARTPELRRVGVAFLAFSMSEHATWLAVLVYALQRGGPREVGVVAVVQLLPGIVLAPFAAYGGDRFPPQRALAVGYAAQSVSMAATAIAMASGAPILAYAAATCAATCITFTRPVMGSLLPLITHAPSDLVAANVVTGFIEQIGVFAGPLLAGGLMVLASPSSVFGVAAGATAVGCLLVLRIDPIGGARPVVDVGVDTIVSQVFAGFRTMRHEGRLRVLIWIGVTAGFVKGIGDVIFVTFADARLDGGGGQSGLLAAAYGIGAMVGAIGVTRLVHGGGVSRHAIAGGLFAAIPLLGLAGVNGLGLALVGFAALGVGETTLQLVSSVSIQREAPPDVLARVFGILEGMQMGAIALGSLAVTALVARSTVGQAFVALAVLVLVGVLGGVARLRRHGDDVPMVDDALVRRLLADPVFAPLPAPTVERLARDLRTVTCVPGEVVVEQGAPGEDYFLVVGGEFDVTVDGRHTRRLDAGRSFGEIALLRDVPRTATVVATTAGELLAVARDDFLAAVTGHPRSLGAATDTVTRLLDP